MNEQNTPQLTTEELGALLTGEADQSLYDRLEEFPELKAQLDAAIEFDMALRSALSSKENMPSAQELGEYHLGLLSDEHAKKIEDAIKKSPRLALELKELQLFMDTAQHDTIIDNVPSKPSHIHILSPTIIDEAHLPHVAGKKDPILRFSGDGYEVRLSIQQSYSGKKLTGELTREDQTFMEVASVQADLASQHSVNFEVSDLGYFEADWSYSGRFMLTIVAKNGQVIQVGPAEI